VVPALVAAGHAVTAVVRSEAKASVVRAAGATPVHVELFDRDAIRAAIEDHDCVANLATHIPSGPLAAVKAAWRINDKLRRDAANAIAGAVIDAGIGRMIQESITFPYVERGDRWIDEGCDRVYFWGNESTVVAEAAAASVTAAGGTGIVLRFAMFMAPDSAHMQGVFGAARRGLFALLGELDSYISFIHLDDAAAAVVAALRAPAATYNVAEPDPVRREKHCEMLAAVVGRAHLRPMPSVVERAGGDVTASIARSHRISSRLLQGVSSWSPTIHCVDRWKELQ
jgi:nucleoside-diphosphate-sugar epimerase